MTVYIITAAIALVFSALYAAAETAYNFANPNRLEDRKENGIVWRCAYWISEHYNIALTANLVGVNIAHFGMSAAITYLIYRLLSSSSVADSVIALIATVFTTVIMLIFGEIMPKTYASIKPEESAGALSIPVFASVILFFPAVFLLNALIKLVSGKPKETVVTDDELQTAIEQSEEEGGIEEDKSELLQSAIDFKDTDIRNVIVPRVDIVAHDMNDGIDALIELIKETSHSRIPLYTDSIDKIEKILFVNPFLLEMCREGKDKVDLEKCTMDPIFIYPSASLPDALEKMRDEKMQMAVVPDEYGGVLGIVTMEDILEELVGDINDETDIAQEEIVPVKKDIFEVSGDMNIYDAFEELGIDEDEIESDYTTVSGWVIEQLEGFPEVGKSFRYKNYTFTITVMDNLVVDTVSAKREESEEEKE